MSSESIQQQKKKLRRQYRSIRQELPDEKRLQNDQAINHHVATVCRNSKYRTIAGYLAFDCEPEISQALSGLNSGEVEIYLPIIGAGGDDNPLGFRQWSPAPGNPDDENLEPNRFGINEPVIGKLCEISKLDAVLIPLVAWDRKGGRLGMGAGYYDRALFEVAHLASPLRIGVAYEAQRDDALPMNDFDIPLHGVITEKGLFTFGD